MRCVARGDHGDALPWTRFQLFEFTELVHQAEKGAKLGDVCWCWELDDGTKLRWIGRDAVGADVEAAKGCLCLGKIELQPVQRDSMLTAT